MSVGDRTEKRLVGPVALTNSNATVGSAVPSSRVWVAKQVIICNTDGADRLVYLAIGTAATVANRFISALPIAAADTIVLDTALVMTAGEQLYGYADTGSVVSVTMVGWEKEV
jgi:hypothetical protein